MEKVSRNIKMDNYKGILIYLVVLGHLLFSYDYYNSSILLGIVRFIYSFHMPLFLIISGYFSKNVTKKNMFQLFIFFVMLNLSYVVYDYVVMGNFDLFSVKYSAWYLLALFIYRGVVFFPKIRNFIISNGKWFLVSSFIISVCLGLVNVNNVFVRIIVYFFFFILGFLLDNRLLERKVKGNSVVLVLLLGLLLVVAFLVPFPLDFYMGGSYSYFVQLIFRGLIFVLDILLFFSIYRCLPNKEMIFFNKSGKNSLFIYGGHRILTLLITNSFINRECFVWVVVVSSFLLCLVLGSNVFSDLMRELLDFGWKLWQRARRGCLIVGGVVFLGLVGFYFRDELRYYYSSIVRAPVVSYEKLEEIDNSISLGFVGDLILLENQVNNYYSDGEYNFDDMFKYTSRYFNEVDYMIGVLEGPVDDGKEYSVGNFDDEKELRLNYPGAFLDSIKMSGIDLVTTANNHLLDSGIDSAYQTIRNLESRDINFIGSYMSALENESDRRKIVTVDGVRLGILAYTYGINNVSEEEIWDEYLDLSNYLCSSNSKYFTRIKKRVEADFAYLNSMDVDYIIVLPHYGTQFMDEADDFQKLWNDIFIENGADVILGSHSHHVQPIEYKDGTVIVNSVGNYVNSYVDYDGDVSMMVKIYLHKDGKKVSAVSVVPLLAVQELNGAYFSVPVYEVYNNEELMGIKEDYADRLEYANWLVSKVAMNVGIAINGIENEYLFIDGKYVRQNEYVFKLTEQDKESVVYQKVESNDSICFVGDSITEGTKNSYHPWYEELINLFEEKSVFNFSKGGYTTSEIISEYSDSLKNSSCSLVVINIGTNDIRYYMRDVLEYGNNMRSILDVVKEKEVILLTPWRTTNNDVWLKSDRDEKRELYDEYDKELREIALENSNVTFVDGNSYIKKALLEVGEDVYLLDGVHPNDSFGVKLYSYAVLRDN